jgi:hypothetical protein
MSDDDTPNLADLLKDPDFLAKFKNSIDELVDELPEDVSKDDVKGLEEVEKLIKKNTN